MKKLTKNVIKNLCTITLAGCVVSGVAALDFDKADAASATLPSLTITNVEVRVPDVEKGIAEGMRIVFSLSAQDYQAFQAAETYQLGVLIAPERKVADADLKYDADGSLSDLIAFYEYDATYTPKFNETANTYEFSVVLKDIPTDGYYADAISSVAYLKTGENAYEYSDVNTESMASVTAGVYSGLSAELQAQVETYIVGGFCEVTGNYDPETKNAYQTIAEINAANAIETSLNGGVIMMGQADVADVYSSTIAVKYQTELQAIFGEVEYDVTGATVSKDGKISATEKNLGGVDSQGNSLKNTYTVSYMDGILASRGEFVVIDETIREVNSFWQGGAVGTGVLYQADQSTMNAHATKGVDDMFSNVALVKRNDISANSATIVTDGSVYDGYLTHVGAQTGAIKKISYQGNAALSDVNYSPYFKLQMQYTKEQIKLLMDLGYDVLKIPAYLEVADDENGLQSQALGYGTRNYVQVISPTDDNIARLTYRDDAYTRTLANRLNNALFYVNDWQNIRIPLSWVYKNYDKLTRMPQAGDAGGASLVLFGLENQLSNSVASSAIANYDTATFGLKDVPLDGNTNFYRNFYFGDVTVCKNAEIAEDDVSENAIKNIIDLENVNHLNNLRSATTLKNGATNSNSVWTYNARIWGGVTEGATVGGRTGTFYNATTVGSLTSVAAALNNHTNLNISTKNPDTDNYSLFYHFSCSKEYLQTLASKYKTLSFDIYCDALVGFETEVDGNGQTQYKLVEGNRQTKQSTVGFGFETLYTTGWYLRGNPVVMQGKWTTVNIPLTQLVSQYDYFQENSTQRRGLVHITGIDYPVSFTFADFCLKK